MAAVFDPLTRSDGEIDDAQEMLIERQEGSSGDRKRLEKRPTKRSWPGCNPNW